MITPISICIIAKNEEEHMEAFMKSIKTAFLGKPVEIIVLDTGSKDATKKIAKRYADRVEDFTWISDFSAARNRSIELASNDWILVLDCDEMVMHANFDDMQRFIREHPDTLGQLLRHNHYQMNGTDGVYNDRVERLFNRKIFHYFEPIHEQVVPLDKDHEYVEAPIDVEVDHSGYLGSEEKKLAKAKRNNDILFDMLEKNPDNPNNPYIYFQIGQSYNMVNDQENAAKYFGKGLEFDVNPNLKYVHMMVQAYGYSLLALKRYDEALQFENIYDTFGDNADFDCLMGLIYMRTNHILKAMEQFLKATTYETSEVEGANSFLARYNMGVINEALGNNKDALMIYKACGAFKPALERIAELEKCEADGTGENKEDENLTKSVKTCGNVADNIDSVKDERKETQT